MGSLSFSQTLRPQVISFSGDTMLAFTVPQSKEIAKHITKALFCDSLAYEYRSALSLCDTTISYKNSQIKALNSRIASKDKIIENLESETGILGEKINKLGSDIKKQKLQKTGALIISAVLLVLVII
jgi:hypothetical protein